MPRALEIAIREAVGRRGVSVLVLPGDVALQPASDAPPVKAAGLLPAAPVVTPSKQDLERLAALLNGESRVTILCGSGCQGAHNELLALGERLKAPMVHALRGKEHVEWDNPYDVGMTGLIGFSSGYYAMLDCDVLLMLGTDFPYRQFYPQGPGVRIAQVDIRAENIGRRAAVDLAVVGDVRATIAALLPLLKQKRDGTPSRAGAAALCQGTQSPRRSGRRHAGQGADPPAAGRQGDQRPRRKGRRLHLRCWVADRVGRPLSGDERQPAPDRVVLARLDGQCAWRKASAPRRPSPAGR